MSDLPATIDDMDAGEVALVVGLLVIGAVVGWLARSATARGEAMSLRGELERTRGRTAAELAAAQSEAANRGTVAEALAPVHHTLASLAERLALAERAETQARAAVSDQLNTLTRVSGASADQLARETRRLVSALSRSDVRGRWGEMQLRRLLQASGLIAGVHYDEQVSTNDGAHRPDVLVHASSDLTIVIDAKVSLGAFLTAEAADPGPELEAALTAHAREVRKHVDRLASKDYWQDVATSPQLVVMFLPAEALLSEALARDPQLLEHAFERNVVPATPTTLLALLRTVGQLWRTHAVAENAAQIEALGRELYDRLIVFADHLDRLGAGLGSAVGAYNKAVASLESRVLVSGRRFADLQGRGAESGRPLQCPRQVELATRRIALAHEPHEGENEHLATA